VRANEIILAEDLLSVSASYSLAGKISVRFPRTREYGENKGGMCLFLVINARRVYRARELQ
jgi:hypothetical protein